ncbi:ESCRT-II complex, Vps25 subunit, N-terminal winged helix,Winged helix-turn-helix DNA-binding [Cinara cedri]|uniref:Vacuolar protein-sorting-associated protein 25 n=1 Tax=Cinara cedri TaxID=506608 RepID=A0A5E4NQH6_9HEMI|nr:ESCRT-II complex, Vps25 subunit, N-terminal winged helix,Winged helix-turn-helix DNA-binding [Cinara cedri]
MGEVQWPWQYSFPPFFTIQPNLETRKKQLDAWRSLVLDYCRLHKIFIIDVREGEHLPLFNNTAISRKLSPQAINTVLEVLLSTGNAGMVDKSSRSRWYVYWHTVDEWATIVYKWAQDNAMVNTVCTFYELTNSSGDLNGLDEGILVKALKVLEKRQLAEILTLDSGSGVKFFS